MNIRRNCDIAPPPPTSLLLSTLKADATDDPVILNMAMSEAAILLKSLMKRRWKFTKPIKTCISCTDSGSGHFLTTSFLFSSILISSVETTKLRNLTSL